jgi:hypothetical protein
MKLSASLLHVTTMLHLLGALLLSAGSAMAELVTLPTPMGDREFDSTTFASGILEGPSGEFACFTGGVVSACSAGSLALAVVGPDLTTGLTLGLDGLVRLSLPATGPVLAIWEAGDFEVVRDVRGLLVSVHTAAGWSAEQSYGPGRLAPVANDTEPSGYATNFSYFTSEDFGLAPGTVFDAVQLRSCCGITANADILAVAAIPEPGIMALMLAGAVAMMIPLQRRKQGALRFRRIA